MSQRPILLFVSLCLVAVGSYFLIKTFTKKADTYFTVDAGIIEQAKAKVPEPTLPPKPSGRVVTVTEEKQITKDVPVVRHQLQNIGLITTTIPRITVEKRTETVDVPVQKLIDASPAEMAAWNSSVAVAQLKYQEDLNARITALVQEKKAKERSEDVETVIKITKKAVVLIRTHNEPLPVG